MCRPLTIELPRASDNVAIHSPLYPPFHWALLNQKPSRHLQVYHVLPQKKNWNSKTSEANNKSNKE